MTRRVTETEALEFKRLYVDEKRSLSQIGTKTGWSIVTVHSYLHALGVEMRPATGSSETSYRGKKAISDEEAEEMRRLYVEEEYSTPQIAKLLVRATAVVGYTLKHRLGVKLRPEGSQQLPDIPVGSAFGRLTTTSRPYRGRDDSDYAVIYVDAVCECGTHTAPRITSLRSGRTKSCGCLGRWGDRESPGSPNGTKAKLEWLSVEKDAPCADCGKAYPSGLMQFDHVPGRGPKEFLVNICTMGSRRTLDEVRAERAKCDLVCSLCHDARTLARTGDEGALQYLRNLGRLDSLREVKVA